MCRQICPIVKKVTGGPYSRPNSLKRAALSTEIVGMAGVNLDAMRGDLVGEKERGKD